MGAPRAAAALSAFFSSVFAFAATADDNGDGVPDFFGCNNVSVAADTLLPAVVVGSVSGAAAARLSNASGWLGANQTRALAGLIAGGAALATLHARLKAKPSKALAEEALALYWALGWEHWVSNAEERRERDYPREGLPL